MIPFLKPFQRVPLGAYLAAIVLVVCGVCGAGVAQYGKSRYAAGRASVTAGGRVNGSLLGPGRIADSLAQATTDTIVERLVVTRWRVDTLLRAVPDTLRAVPEIAALMRTTMQLTAQVDTLTRTLDVERAVSRLRASTDSAALAAATVVIAAQADDIRTLSRRPRWAMVGLAAFAGVVAGVLR